MIIETPLNLHPVLMHLKNISIVMHNYAQCHLKHYLKCCADKFKIVQDQKLTSFLPTLLPKLKYVLSDECTSIIKALKRLAWSNQSTWHTDMQWKSVLEQEEHIRQMDELHIYSQAFWERDFPHFDLFCNNNAKVNNITWKIIYDPTKYADGNIHALKILVEEKIIKPGRLSGVSSETILDAVEVSQRTLFKPMAFYNQYIGKIFSFLLLSFCELPSR